MYVQMTFIIVFGTLVHQLVMTTQHANTTYVPRACTSFFGNWYMKLYHHYSMNP